MTQLSASSTGPVNTLRSWVEENEASLLAWGIAIARITLGIIFFMHGYQKVFQFGLPGVIANFGQIGIPIPAVTGTLITLLEVFGGLALIFGVFTRFFSALFTIEFIVAIFTVHFVNGFFASNGGYEFPLMLLAGSILTLLAGSGALAVDNNLFKR